MSVEIIYNYDSDHHYTLPMIMKHSLSMLHLQTDRRQRMDGRGQSVNAVVEDGVALVSPIKPPATSPPQSICLKPQAPTSMIKSKRTTRQ